MAAPIIAAVAGAAKAIGVGTLVTAGATLGAAALGAKAQKDAAKQAASAQQAAQRQAEQQQAQARKQTADDAKKRQNVMRQALAPQKSLFSTLGEQQESGGMIQ